MSSNQDNNGVPSRMSSNQDNNGECGTRQRSSNNSKPRHRTNSGHKSHFHLSGHLKVTRPVYTESTFQKRHRHSEDKYRFPVAHSLRERMKKCKCNVRVADLQRFLLKLVPILNWLPRYDVKSDFVGDLIAGCTIGVMRIPQAMAYALLATLPAVYGLYLAFYPVLVYTVFGTSRHISIGTFALVSIMTGNAIDNFLSKQKPSDISTPTPSMMPYTSIGTTIIIVPDGAPQSVDITEDGEGMERIQIAMALCLLVGFVQIIMGVLRLGFVTIYLSEPLVRGFTTGAAVHVFTSQFKGLFGISVPRFTGVFSIVKSYIHLFSNLHQTNTTTLIISIVSITVLMASSEILDYHANRGLSSCCVRNESSEAEENGQENGQTSTAAKERKPKKKLPIPTELLVIIIATAVSYVGKFENDFGVKVVGNIPIGLPVPVVPHFSYMGTLFPDAIAIAIVAFAISVSMASLMGKRNNYEIDSNQELLALGSCSIASSFFYCFPQSASLSRSVVQESSGGKTQVAGLVSSVLVLVVLLYLGKMFTQLPVACLAAVIVVALRGMFRQLKDLLLLWKVSMIDLSIWIVSFLAVVFIGVDLGLLVAVLYSLITVIVRTQKPDCVLMGRVPGTDIYRDVAVIEAAEELPGIKLFRASSSLCFVNVEHFKTSLYSKVGIDPQKVLSKGEERAACACLPNKRKENLPEDKELPNLASGGNGVVSTSVPQTPEPPVSVKDTHTVIIDCSQFSYIDVVGIKMLQTIVGDYKKLGIRVVFANCKGAVRQSLLLSSKLSKDHNINLEHMYISVHDAVLHFYTPSTSPINHTSNKSTSPFDFDPIAVAASKQTLTPHAILNTLQGLEAAQRRPSTTTVLTEVGDDNRHSTTTVMTDLDSCSNRQSTATVADDDVYRGIHRVELHECCEEDLHNDNRCDDNDVNNIGMDIRVQVFGVGPTTTV